MSTQIEPQSSTQEALKAYGSFPFDSDEPYQQGLASILAGGTLPENPPPEVRDEIIRRTRVFYFNKMTGHSITMDEAREYELSQRGHSVGIETTETEDETRVLTFAELKELIETGKVDQIPNNKVIPERLNDAPPSQSTAHARKKPWETTAES